MHITVNGEEREVGEAITVAGLIEVLSLSPVKIAIERNLQIVPKSQFAHTALEPGDTIEIVQFVGGG